MLMHVTMMYSFPT